MQILTDPLSLKQCVEWLKLNSNPLPLWEPRFPWLREGMMMVTHTPLKVFKVVKARNGEKAIANLIIPAGATIYAREPWNHSDSDMWSPNSRAQRKMRASEAYVHSIYTRGQSRAAFDCGWVRTIDQEGVRQIQRAVSLHNESFAYVTGRHVKPEFKFSMTDSVCESGIHFFFNLEDALCWSLW